MKKRTKIIVALLVIILMGVAHLGFISFLLDRYGYIDRNEDKYDIKNTILSEDVVLNLSGEDSVMINDIKISVVNVEKNEDSVLFTIFLDYNFHYRYGEMLSLYYAFDYREESDTSSDPGKIYLEYENQLYECKGKGISFVNNSLMFNCTMHFDDAQSMDLENASIRLSNLYYTEYTRH